MLSEGYGSSLDPNKMAVDPIYALLELFQFMAASEAQYLDTISSVLDDNVTSKSIERSKNAHDIRATLALSYNQLEHRRNQITSTIDFLRSQSRIQFGNEETDTCNIIRDYEYLLRSAGQLMTRCDHEWNVIMSEATVEDAQWSRDQSIAQHKFTVLATIYVPISFSCSLFGMTFFELGSLRQGFIYWTAVTVPVLLFSLALLFSDYIQRFWFKWGFRISKEDKAL